MPGGREPVPDPIGLIEVDLVELVASRDLSRL
jgi:hypothetical protein